MAKFLKHIGKHGDRKVAVVFREIPGETHMCLVVYTQLLNQNIHDPLMSTIESDLGQNSENLADALNRSYTKDGQIILQVLHREGMLKKIQTEQIVMTPAPNQIIRLNELNALLDEMNKGEEAIRRLAEIDSSRGLQDPKDVARRMREAKAAAQAQKATTAAPGALGDNELANNLRQQAARMDAEAKGLMSEAQRLLKEAAELEGVKLESSQLTETSATKKTRAKTTKVAAAVEPPVTVAPEPTKRAGRPKKAVVAG